MKQFRDVTRSDYLKIALWVILYVAVIIVGSVFILPYYLPYGVILWVLIVLIGLYLLVRWDAGNFGYHCPDCENDFTISVAHDFISPHSGNKKLLVCPQCKHKAWMSPRKIIL
jgi:DNA-directed RNA polymerase subunit RPC12/RpoP